MNMAFLETIFMVLAASGMLYWMYRFHKLRMQHWRGRMLRQMCDNCRKVYADEFMRESAAED